MMGYSPADNCLGLGENMLLRKLTGSKMSQGSASISITNLNPYYNVLKAPHSEKSSHEEEKQRMDLSFIAPSALLMNLNENSQ